MIMARTPTLLCYPLFILSALSTTAFAEQLSRCRLEAIDMVTDTAAALCDSKTILLQRGDSLRGFSVVDISADKVTLTAANGDRILWYSATTEAPSRTRKLLARPPERIDDALQPPRANR